MPDILGEYTYSNFTLLNPAVSLEEFISVSYHEYTHMILTLRSCVGQMLYCLEKIKIPPNAAEDKLRYKAITGFLNAHTQKVQESLAVFTQCVMKLVNEGSPGLRDLVKNLEDSNKRYFKYIKPLLPILSIMEQEEDKDIIFPTAGCIFSLGMEAMNAKLYELNPENFCSPKQIKKFISNPDLSSQYLPDSYFLKHIKECCRNSKNCIDIQKFIIDLIHDEPNLEEHQRRLDDIKSFILRFFHASKYKQLYESMLSRVSAVKESNLEDLYLHQLPSFNFDEDELYSKSREADAEEIYSLIESEYSIILMLGTIDYALQFLSEKFGMNLQPADELKDFAGQEILFYYNLKTKDIARFLIDRENMLQILQSRRRKSLIVISYKIYDFENDAIKNYPDIEGDIFIYCDRTYNNAKIFLDAWRGRKVFYRYMEYLNMIVLVVKIREHVFFLLPMTSITASEADLDIISNRKYMHMANNNTESAIYDEHIFRDNTMLDYIDTIINCLFLMGYQATGTSID